MRSTPREYFTIDLRGLRAALAACAASEGVTESDLLRSALAAKLATDANASIEKSSQDDETGRRTCLKLSLRVRHRAGERLDQNARAAGLSRGVYLTRLLEGAPAVVASADRSALAAALKRSAEELARLSRDLHHLLVLLSKGSSAEAKHYRARLDAVDGLVWAHLDLAARALAEVTPSRMTGACAKRQP
jgi:hypothetical protein